MNIVHSNVVIRLAVLTIAYPKALALEPGVTIGTARNSRDEKWGSVLRARTGNNFK
jgi:hypothetical protein